VAALLEEPEVRRDADRPEPREVPDVATVEEPGSVVLCAW
jgi:hypothetical protein